MNASWSGPYNNEIECAIFNQSRVAVGRFKSFQDPVTKLDRIRESVERKRMLGCPRSVEIVNGRSSGQNEIVVRDLLAVVELNVLTGRINSHHRRHVKRYVVLMPKQAAYRRTYVFGV